MALNEGLGKQRRIEGRLSRLKLWLLRTDEPRKSLPRGSHNAAHNGAHLKSLSGYTAFGNSPSSSPFFRFRSVFNTKITTIAAAIASPIFG
jgi:hypothetical protein